MVGILECVIVGWLFNLPQLRAHINKISSIKLGLGWELLIKFLVPIALSIILIGDLYIELTTPYGDYSWASLILIGRDWLLITILVAFIFASRPWKTQNNISAGRSD